ncbi:protein RarD [Sphingomonas ginsenosidimutans]|uniref:Protein RarD n=1 Tax=Sphingomonas ginsenosidimutans TaxID=862134 RepID=A0A2A4HZU0_9SPHN|nr:EamA family transporter RarD [Sphingomonas ginsenosidimutans]MEE2915799.1 EamA family transporter RarD [Pseudomonadota bacterium]PCG09890.1 protein RarD [Sphingomonas ginsenosidimutans]
MTDRHDATRSGLILGIGAYAAWGLLPLYLRLLRGVPSLEVLAHRIVWSLLLLIVIVVVTRRAGAIRAAARGPTLALLAASATLIAINWLVYIWAVQHGHVLEASLGYFINPLVNVALGMALLGERIGRVQKAAVAVAAAGVAVMALSGGGALWISLTLALSFGTYGLIRKVAAIDSLGGLTVETALLLVPALAVIAMAQVGGQGAFGQDRTVDLLLVLAGAVTAVPLLMFAAAARRLRYATMGLLQYIAPTLQFVEAVALFHEPLRPVHLVTFALIWTGCALYAWGGWRRGD